MMQQLALAVLFLNLIQSIYWISNKHTWLHNGKNHPTVFFVCLVHQRCHQDTSWLTHPVQIRLLQFPTGSLPTVSHQPLQHAQNSTTTLILKSHRAKHAKPLFKILFTQGAICTEYYFWHSDWLKLLRWLAARNPLLGGMKNLKIRSLCRPYDTMMYWITQKGSTAI